MKSFLKKILSFSLLLVPCLLVTSTAHAQLTSDVNSAFKLVGGNPFKYNDLGCLVGNGVTWALAAASLAMFGYLILGGITWITSSGEKNKLESARDKITAALVGLVIVVASWAIFIIIQSALGLPIGLTNAKCKINYNNGSSSSGSTSGGFNGDCCTIVGGSEINPTACCNLVSTVGCISGNRYQVSASACGDSSKFGINWSCWEGKYDSLVKSGQLNPKTDPCTKR